MKYPLVKINWVDASRLSDGWMDMEKIPGAYLHKCVSVGFVIKENEDGIILVPTIADIEHEENTHTYGGMLIPTCSILSKKKLS